MIAGSVELLENFRQMSVACACRNDFAGSKERVLDVDIGNIGGEHFISLRRILTALDKVRKVERAGEVLSCKLLHQVEAAGCVVAVNTFFIFMQQGDIVMRSLCNHRLRPEKHLGAAVCRSIVFRDIEAEHTDIGRFEDVCHLFRMGKLLQVRIEIIVNSDFADRRADGGNADICLIELFLLPLLQNSS